MLIGSVPHLEVTCTDRRELRGGGGYLRLPGVVLVPIAAPLEQVLHLPVLPEPLVQHLHIQIFVYNSVRYPVVFFINISWGIFLYYIQHCFICRPSDSTVPTGALAVRRSNHLARVDLIRKIPLFSY